MNPLHGWLTKLGYDVAKLPITHTTTIAEPMPEDLRSWLAEKAAKRCPTCGR